MGHIVHSAIDGIKVKMKCVLALLCLSVGVMSLEMETIVWHEVGNILANPNVTWTEPTCVFRCDKHFRIIAGKYEDIIDRECVIQCLCQMKGSYNDCKPVATTHAAPTTTAEPVPPVVD